MLWLQGLAKTKRAGTSDGFSRRTRVAVPRMTTPLLRPYQVRWLADESPLCCWVKSRRIGGTFVASLKLALGAIGWDIVRCKYIEPRDGLIFSASQRQSIEVLKECALHLKSIGAVGEQFGIIKASDIDASAMCIKLPNGCSIHAFSSKPGSARGYGGNVLWDEAGSTPHAEALYQAILPLVNPSIRYPTGCTLSVVGTALDDGSFFHKLCEGKEGEAFSRHRTDIYQAHKEGNPADPEDLRGKTPDVDRFNAEYMCMFMSAATRYIGADAYDACLFDEADMPDGYWPRFGGMDIGRKNHESVIVDGYKIGDTIWQHDVSQRERAMAWNDQEAWVDRDMELRTRFAVDATGLGNQFAERLEKRHPSKIESVTFTGANKELLATGLKLGIESKRVRLRRDDIRLRTDVLSLRRVFTDAGHARYDADEAEDGSHADGAWAAGLMVYAAGGVAKGKVPRTRVHVGSEKPEQRPVRVPSRRGEMFR